MTPKASLHYYKVLIGFSYPRTSETYQKLIKSTTLSDAEREAVVANAFTGNQMKRVEVGDVVSDLPAGSLPWLLEQKVVEEVTS